MNKMGHFTVALFVCAALSGCVGAQLVTPKKVETENPKEFIYRDKSSYLSLRGQPHERKTIDGKEAWVFVQDETEWCGLFLYIVIPIPLALPACEWSDTIVWDAEGMAIRQLQRETTDRGGYCAPLAPLFGKAIGHHSDVKVCE